MVHVGALYPAGFDGTYGRLYTQSDYGSAAYLRFDGTTTYSVGAGQAETLNASDIAGSPKSAYYRKERFVDTLYASGDNAGVIVYYRTKNTSNSWVQATAWATYTSQTYEMNFDNFDYKWYIYDNQ